MFDLCLLFCRVSQKRWAHTNLMITGCHKSDNSVSQKPSFSVDSKYIWFMIKTIVISKAYNVRIMAIIIIPASSLGLTKNLFSKFGVTCIFLQKIKENQNVVNFAEIFGTMFLRYTQTKIILHILLFP